MRTPIGLFALGLGCALAGCATRTAPPVRDGWARLPGSIRLNTEAPPLPPRESLTERGATADPGYGWADGAEVGDAGPRGARGESDPYAYGYGAPVYVAPGGAVPPGLRTPTDERPTSPYGTPYRSAFPSADVTEHRPGLSTGSGVYGRSR